MRALAAEGAGRVGMTKRPNSEMVPCMKPPRVKTSQQVRRGRSSGVPGQCGRWGVCGFVYLVKAVWRIVAREVVVSTINLVKFSKEKLVY